MTEEIVTMRRPVGVVVAASILGIMAVVGLCGIALSFAGMFLMHNPALQNPALHRAPGGQAVVAGIELVLAGVLVFCLWTAVGLFRLRKWARYSVIVIGILTFILNGSISALMFVLRHWFASPHFARTAAKTAITPALPCVFSIALIAIGAIYAAIALIGLWWAIYFNLKRVRLAFTAAGGAALTEGQISAAGEHGSEYGLWHGVVIAFACLMLAGVIVFLGMAWLRPPFFLLGITFRGSGALAIALIFAAIQLFIGIGLLARLRPAYWTAVGWQVFGVLSAALMLVPSYAARVLAAGNELTKRFMPASSMNPTMNSSELLSLQQHFLLLTVIASVVMFLIFLYALLRCRRLYLGGDPAADAA